MTIRIGTFALVGALALLAPASAVLAQQAAGSSSQAAIEAQRRQALVDSIVQAREAASGLVWDAPLRSSFESRLTPLPLDVLARIDSEGGTADLSPFLLGSSTSDQVYTPVTPCRFVDGIQAADRPLAFAGSTNTRYYQVRGSTSSVFISQGAAFSAPDGCGIPTSATAITVNLTAADPSADGHLTVDPAHSSGVSKTSTLNYTFGGARGRNLANGAIVPLCNLLLSSCSAGSTPVTPTRDIKVTFSAGSSSVDTYFLADVTGYFSPPQQPELGTVKAGAHVTAGTTPTVTRCFVITSATTSASACTPGTTVKVARLAAGVYSIDFGLNVASRYFMATVGNDSGATGGGSATVTPLTGNAFAVFVEVYDKFGAAADKNFYVQVF